MGQDDGTGGREFHFDPRGPGECRGLCHCLMLPYTVSPLSYSEWSPGRQTSQCALNRGLRVGKHDIEGQNRDGKIDGKLGAPDQRGFFFFGSAYCLTTGPSSCTNSSRLMVELEYANQIFSRNGSLRAFLFSFSTFASDATG